MKKGDGGGILLNSFFLSFFIFFWAFLFELVVAPHSEPTEPTAQSHPNVNTWIIHGIASAFMRPTCGGSYFTVFDAHQKEETFPLISVLCGPVINQAHLGCRSASFLPLLNPPFVDLFIPHDPCFMPFKSILWANTDPVGEWLMPEIHFALLGVPYQSCPFHYQLKGKLPSL